VCFYDRQVCRSIVTTVTRHVMALLFLIFLLSAEKNDQQWKKSQLRAFVIENKSQWEGMRTTSVFIKIKLEQDRPFKLMLNMKN